MQHFFPSFFVSLSYDWFPSAVSFAYAYATNGCEHKCLLLLSVLSECVYALPNIFFFQNSFRRRCENSVKWNAFCLATVGTVAIDRRHRWHTTTANEHTLHHIYLRVLRTFEMRRERVSDVFVCVFFRSFTNSNSCEAATLRSFFGERNIASEGQMTNARNVLNDI